MKDETHNTEFSMPKDAGWPAAISTMVYVVCKWIAIFSIVAVVAQCMSDGAIW